MILNVKVIPQSRENGFVDYRDGVLKVRIVGTPVKGKVNENLIAFLAKTFALPKGQITLVAGQTSPRKKIALNGLEEEAFQTWMSTQCFSSH